MLQRSLRVLQKCGCLYTSRHLKLHTAAALYSRFDKDLPTPSLPVSASKLYGPDTDILLQNLRKCQSLDKLLEFVNMHLGVMNSKHIVACLENLHTCIKAKSPGIENLQQDPAFKSLCARLMKVVQFLEPQELITAYKTLTSLEIRSNTYVVQAVLKMLGNQLNDMTFAQLIFLYFLVNRQRHNSLVDGLKLAIPLVLQVQIDQQIDSNNLSDVVSGLQLSCRAGLKPATIQKIVNFILQKGSILTTENAATVIFALLNIETPVDGYNELMSIAFDTISNDIEEIDSKQLHSLLASCRTHNFHHFKFLFAVSELVVRQKLNLKMTYSVLSLLYSLDFCPPKLIDHFANALCSEAEEYRNSNAYSPLNCVEYLTATAHRPANVDDAARVLYSDERRFEVWKSRTPHLCLKFLSCLAMLGHFPQDFLSKVLNEDFLYNTWTNSKKIGRLSEFDRHLLHLYWSLEVYDETNNFVIPPTILKKAVQMVYKRHLNAEYPLAKFIENGLGGRQFIRSGVFTEDGLVIDHMVAMRSGNYPVSLQNVKSKAFDDKSMQHFLFVEDIVIPEDAKIIALIVAKEEDYYRELELLRSWVDLKVRCLNKKNYGTVVINYRVWSNLPDREKIPYLMREIKEAVPDSSSSARSNYNS